MLKNSLLVTVQISGVNLNRIYKQCLSQQIKIANIKQLDHKNIIFDIEKSKLNDLKKIAKQYNYDLSVIKRQGFVRLFSSIKKRIGLIVGAVICLVTCIVSSLFIWDIKVYGNQQIDMETILNVLKENGIETGKILQYKDFDDLEIKLSNGIDNISLCSIVRKGCSIIVNIKEKIIIDDLIDETGKDILATQNMTINSLSVVQGTALKKIGDSVKAGDVIVAGYFYDSNGKKVECKANASIGATIWYSENLIYPKVKEVYTKTGNKIENSYMIFFGNKFSIKNSENTFEFFEVEENCNAIFNNNFLPYYLHTTTFFETTKSLVEQNFEADKESIIQDLRQKVIDKIPDNLVINKLFDMINEDENSYIVTSYAEIDVNL